jgi:hypothetical protein
LNGAFVVCSSLLLTHASGCASRGYGGEQAAHSKSSGSGVQSHGNSDLASALAVLPRPKVTGVKGNAIHESENKQPAYVNQLLTRILSESAAASGAEFQISTRKQSLLPGIERPAEGYGSSIGKEDYIGRAAAVIAPVEPLGSNLAEAAQNANQWAELQESWKNLGKAAAKGDYPVLAAMIREYFSGPPMLAFAPPRSVDFSAVLANSLFDEVGYWHRSDRLGSPKSGSNAKATLKGLSIGERVMARNRALILIEIGAGRAKDLDRSATKLRASIDALATGDAQDKLMWARTHVVIRPQKTNELALAIGKLSVLGYSFAQISDVTETGFRLRLLSYQFAYAVPSWDGAMTSQVMDSLCQARPHRSQSTRKECEALLAANSKLGSPALGEYAARKMARPVALRSYSPAFITDEVVAFESLQSESILLQTQIVDEFPEFGGL